MKKSLSLLVAITMVFSMFASVAFAADTAKEPTTQEKFDALKAAGIFSGFPDGSAGLDKNMTRAQFAKVLTLINELEANAAASTYSDVSANHWAKGFIGAVTEAELMNGIGNNKFDPNGNVTVEALAKTLVLSLGLEPVEGAEVAGASAWAAGYVQAALDAGFLAEMPSYKGAATRGLLVEAAYKYVNGEAVTVKSAVAVDAKTVKVTFSDDEVVTKELSEALKPGVATKVTVEYNGKSYEVEVTLEALQAEAKAVGAKKIEVKFNTAVDTAKASFVVTNPNNVSVNISKVTFADDKKSATVEIVSNIVKGEYKVTVKGLGDDAVAKFTGEDEKVAKIEFTSDKASLDRDAAVTNTVYASFKISNQYGEDVTAAKYSAVQPNLKATPSASITADKYGKLTIVGGNVVKYAVDQKITLTALDQDSTTFGTAVVTVVTAARVDSLTIEKLYNTVDNTKVLNVGSTASDFVLVVKAKDQYGNTISVPAQVYQDVNISSSNPYVVQTGAPKTVTIDGTAELVIPLAAGNTTPAALHAGVAKIVVVPIYSGKTASFDVTVKDLVKVDTLSLTAPTLAPIGEKIEIPFNAVDLDGKAVTSLSDLTVGAGAAITSITSSAGSIAFEQDYVKGQAKLVLNATGVTAKTPVTIVAITGNNKLAQVTFNLVDKAVPTVVSGFASWIGAGDYTKVLADNATSTLNTWEIVVQDQYGRSVDAGALPAGYAVSMTSSDLTKVTVSNGTFQGVAKGTSDITIALTNTALVTATNTTGLVAGSEFVYTARVVEKADIKSYEIGDIAKLQNNTDNNHARTVSVFGVLADGAKAAVPTSYFEVETGNDNLTVNVDGTSLKSAYADAAFSSGDIKGSVIVTVKASAGPEVVTKEVTISNAASYADALALRTGGGATLTDGVIYAPVATVGSQAAIETLANAVVKTIDQYGVTVTTSLKKVVVSNISNSHTVGTIVDKDTFQVVGIAANGKTITFKVVVTA